MAVEAVGACETNAEFQIRLSRSGFRKIIPPSLSKVVVFFFRIYKTIDMKAIIYSEIFFLLASFEKRIGGNFYYFS